VDAAAKTAARAKDFILNYGIQWRVEGLLRSIDGKRVKTMALTEPE